MVAAKTLTQISVECFLCVCGQEFHGFKKDFPILVDLGLWPLYVQCSAVSVALLDLQIYSHLIWENPKEYRSTI